MGDDKMKAYMKKTAGVALTAAIAATLAFSPPAGTGAQAQTVVPAKAQTQITAKAQAKKGFVKVKGKWYYYKSGKKVKGLKKIGGKYYYFAKSGAMQSGKKTVDGMTYYFKKASDKKAPAVANKTAKISGKTYYFSAKGRGILSVGNKKGNQAVAKIIDMVKFQPSASKEDNLKVMYNKIQKRCGYLGTEGPDLGSKKWIYTKAYEMATETDGKCYEYSALTGLCAKALGFDVKILTGKANGHAGFADRTKYTEHSWVVIDDTYILDSVYDDNNGTSGNQFFYKTYEELENEQGTIYQAEKQFRL